MSLLPEDPTESDTTLDTLTLAMLSLTLNVRGEEVSEAGLEPHGSSDLIPFFLVHSSGSVMLTKKQ